MQKTVNMTVNLLPRHLTYPARHPPPSNLGADPTAELQISDGFCVPLVLPTPSSSLLSPYTPSSSCSSLPSSLPAIPYCRCPDGASSAASSSESVHREINPLPTPRFDLRVPRKPPSPTGFGTRTEKMSPPCKKGLEAPRNAYPVFHNTYYDGPRNF